MVTTPANQGQMFFDKSSLQNQEKKVISSLKYLLRRENRPKQEFDNIKITITIRNKNRGTRATG